MESTTQQWTITVNDKWDKINTHVVNCDTEKEARERALKWVGKHYGDSQRQIDWSLHKVRCR